MTRKVGIRKAKENLSRYIHLALEGEEIIITDRGEAVVRLVPVAPSPRSLDEVLDEMADSGLLERGKGKLRKPTRLIRARKGVSVSAVVREQRR